MYLQQMLTIFALPFLITWGGLLACLVIHVGWINSRLKLQDWPRVLYCVAFVDRKTRNNFWHMVVNAFVIALFAPTILYVLGKLHHA